MWFFLIAVLIREKTRIHCLPSSADIGIKAYPCINFFLDFGPSWEEKEESTDVFNLEVGFMGKMFYKSHK